MKINSTKLTDRAKLVGIDQTVKKRRLTQATKMTKLVILLKLIEFGPIEEIWSLLAFWMNWSILVSLVNFDTTVDFVNYVYCRLLHNIQSIMVTFIGFVPLSFWYNLGEIDHFRQKTNLVDFILRFYQLHWICKFSQFMGSWQISIGSLSQSPFEAFYGSLRSRPRPAVSRAVFLRNKHLYILVRALVFPILT